MRSTRSGSTFLPVTRAFGESFCLGRLSAPRMRPPSKTGARSGVAQVRHERESTDNAAQLSCLSVGRGGAYASRRAARIDGLATHGASGGDRAHGGGAER